MLVDNKKGIKVYQFQFVRIIEGKAKPENFSTIQAAHTAMGIYAGIHDLHVDVHQSRWREDARSIMYEGSNPVFGILGYVAQIGPSTPQPEPKSKAREISVESSKISRMPIVSDDSTKDVTREEQKVKTKIRKRKTV
jgi:hypothetical protein